MRVPFVRSGKRFVFPSDLPPQMKGEWACRPGHLCSLSPWWLGSVRAWCQEERLALDWCFPFVSFLFNFLRVIFRVINYYSTLSCSPASLCLERTRVSEHREVSGLGSCPLLLLSGRVALDESFHLSGSLFPRLWTMGVRLERWCRSVFEVKNNCPDVLGPGIH